LKHLPVLLGVGRDAPPTKAQPAQRALKLVVRGCARNSSSAADKGTARSKGIETKMRTSLTTFL